MILVDLNVLIYSIDRSSPRHESAKAWLETTMGGGEDVRLAMQTVLGFLRLSTSASAFDRPLSADQAIDVVEAWLRRPNVEVATPTDRHWQVLRELAAAGQARGPLLMDAHLAALTIEHGATLATTDRDFARFPGLRFQNPIAA